MSVGEPEELVQCGIGEQILGGDRGVMDCGYVNIIVDYLLVSVVDSPMS